MSKCPKCGHEFKHELRYEECPFCGNPDFFVLYGCSVDRISIDKDAPLEQPSIEPYMKGKVMAVICSECKKQIPVDLLQVWKKKYNIDFLKRQEDERTYSCNLNPAKTD